MIVQARTIVAIAACTVVWGTVACDRSRAADAPGADAPEADASVDPEEAGPAPVDATAGDASIAVQAPFFMYYENIYIRVTVGGVPVLLLYDTGSPAVYLDKAAAGRLGLAAGSFDVEVAGLSLGKKSVTLVDTVFGSDPVPGLPDAVVGYAGNALFADHAVGLDFFAKRLLLSRNASGAAPPIPPGVEATAVEVPFDLVKGYLSIPCGFVKGPAKARCLFDTGAMASTCFESNWANLPHPSPSVLPQTSIDSTGATIHSYYQRDEATAIGALEIPGDPVSVTSDFSLLSNLATALHLDLAGLIGVLSFKSLYTTIDYANQRLIFHRFTDSSTKLASPFVGYGFTLDPSSYAVAFVVPASSAALAGVAAGDVLSAVDGASVGSAPPARTFVELIPAPAGTRASFTFMRAGAPRTVSITAADTLSP